MGALRAAQGTGLAPSVTLAAGRDHGGPCLRHGHPGYGAASVLDPDGNTIEAVHHEPPAHPADSAEITRLLPP